MNKVRIVVCLVVLLSMVNASGGENTKFEMTDSLSYIWQQKTLTDGFLSSMEIPILKISAHIDGQVDTPVAMI